MFQLPSLTKQNKRKPIFIHFSKVVPQSPISPLKYVNYEGNAINTWFEIYMLQAYITLLPVSVSRLSKEGKGELISLMGHSCAGAMLS